MYTSQTERKAQAGQSLRTRTHACNSSAEHQHHMTSEAHKYIFLEINGIRPNWIDYDAMSTREIQQNIDYMTKKH